MWKKVLKKSEKGNSSKEMLSYEGGKIITVKSDDEPVYAKPKVKVKLPIEESTTPKPLKQEINKPKLVKWGMIVVVLFLTIWIIIDFAKLFLGRDSTAGSTNENIIEQTEPPAQQHEVPNITAPDNDNQKNDKNSLSVDKDISTEWKDLINESGKVNRLMLAYTTEAITLHESYQEKKMNRLSLTKKLEELSSKKKEAYMKYRLFEPYYTKVGLGELFAVTTYRNEESIRFSDQHYDLVKNYGKGFEELQKSYIELDSETSDNQLLAIETYLIKEEIPYEKDPLKNSLNY